MSLSETGWAQYRFATDKILYGKLPSKDRRGCERLFWIKNLVKNLLNTPETTLVVLEDYAYGAIGRAVIGLGELGGIVRLMLYEEGIDLVLVGPGQLKKWATGNGNCKKPDMIECVQSRFGYKGITNNNQADAILLMELGRSLLSLPTDKTSHSIEAAIKVKHPTIFQGIHSCQSSTKSLSA
jgi:Holliday junction resolvasome RuvABC endonuclease subunit